MLTLLYRVLLSVLVAGIFVHLDGGKCNCQSLEKTTNEEVRGVAEAYALAMQGLRSADCKLEVTIVGDGQEIPTPEKSRATYSSEQTNQIRIAFDLDAKQVFYVNRSSFEAHGFNGEESEILNSFLPILHSYERALSIGDSSSDVFGYLGKGQLQRYSQDGRDRVSFYRLFGIPNIHTVGLRSFTGNQSTDIDLESTVKKLFIPDSMEPVREVSSEVFRVRSRRGQTQAENVENFVEIDWNLQNQVPVRLAGVVLDKQQTVPIATTYAEERITWDFSKELPLPVLIKGRNRIARTVGPTKFLVKQEFDVKFHWQSLNQKLDPELFEKEQIASSESRQRAVSLETSE